MKTLLILLLLCNSTRAQFRLGEQVSTPPSQIISDQYIAAEGKDYNLELEDFNRNNPYTTLQVILDDKENRYFLLMQTSFLGKLVYIGFSKNLETIYNCSGKSTAAFKHCTKKAAGLFTTSEQSEMFIKCFLERLRHCAG